MEKISNKPTKPNTELTKALEKSIMVGVSEDRMSRIVNEKSIDIVKRLGVIQATLSFTDKITEKEILQLKAEGAVALVIYNLKEDGHKKEDVKNIYANSLHAAKANLERRAAKANRLDLLKDQNTR